MKKNITIFILASVCVFFIAQAVKSSNKYKCEDDYSFINPIFACYEKLTINKKGYVDLKLRLMSYINELKKEGQVSDVGLFFRDLEAGPTMGINDRKDFIPASLLKLPHVLALLRLSEEEFPNLLSNKLVYNFKTNIGNKQNFTPPKIIQAGTPYTVLELIERSLKYSDNFAAELLLKHLNEIGGEHDLVGEMYRDLGILDKYDMNGSSVGVKAYSTIYRLLYNSSFLSSDNSEKLLEILSDNSFDQGLRQGLPSNIRVSHKFGEREITKTGEKQLHDCGIIYYPTNPYTLCIMTKGKDFKVLSEVIGKISEEVYKEFDSRKLD